MCWYRVYDIGSVPVILLEGGGIGSVLEFVMKVALVETVKRKR